MQPDTRPICITEHVRRRARDLAGVRPRALQRHVERVWRDGLLLRNWRIDTAETIWVQHGEFVWGFVDETDRLVVVTVVDRRPRGAVDRHEDADARHLRFVAERVERRKRARWACARAVARKRAREEWGAPWRSGMG